MPDDLLAPIHALPAMSLAELQAQWARLAGSPTSFRNPQTLRKQIAWQLQARKYGGLSPEATQQIDDLRRQQG